MSKYSLYVDDVSVDAVFNKLGGVEGARAFLRGEQKLAPASFERNEHGHIVLTITGLDLTGEEEVERLANAGCRMSEWAKSCMLSKKKDGYDKNHLLVAGAQYKIVLMPTREIERNSDRTTDALRTRGIKRYGYGKPLAGIVPRISESVTDKQMEDMGFWYIAVPHDPIKGSGGDPVVLLANRLDDVQWLHADWDHPGSRWSADGAFAFLVSAS